MRRFSVESRVWVATLLASSLATFCAAAGDAFAASSSASLLPDVDDVEYQEDALSTLEARVINATIVGASCELGTYATGTAANSGDCSGYRPCEPGFYCTLEHERVPCPAGTFGATEGLATAECSGLCAAGFFCPEGSTSSTQHLCGGSGFYCPAGSGAPIPVDTGYYTIGDDAGAAGAANRTRSAQILCPQGHFCVGGVRYGCPAGTFNAGLGQTSCDAAGNLCPAGHFCPRGSVQPRPCASSLEYCPQGSGAPRPVQPRYFAASSSADARVRGANLTDSQTFCTPGSYCVNGVRHPCPAGRYGNAAGEVDPLCSGVCEEGYYCPEGSTSPRQVSCGDSSVFCPEGAASPTLVSEGFYTVGGGGELTRTDQEQCEEGYWCEAGLRYECFEGHYGADRGMSNGECSGLCDAGYFCLAQSTSPKQYHCGDKTVFCPVGSSTPTPVSPGHYTIDPADGGDGGMTAERLCGIGHYCQAGVELECAPGHYGSSFGLTEPTCDGQCHSGYFCTAGSTLPTQNLCGGFDVYCPAGSNTTTPVSTGYYTTNENSEAGATGTFGSDGQRQSAQKICEPGHFCKNGVKRSCPAGTYGETEGLSTFECSGICAAGYYCPPASTSAQERQCGAADLWCPEGSALPTHAAEGFYTMPPEDVVVVHRSSASTCFADAVWIQDRDDSNTTTEGYVRVEQGCVSDGHLELDVHDGVDVETCATLCDDAGDLCVGFEYAVEYGGPADFTAHRCELMKSTTDASALVGEADSTSTSSFTVLDILESFLLSCAGAHHNVDFYRKLTEGERGMCSLYPYRARYFMNETITGNANTRSRQVQCEPGYWCSGGKRYECPPGRFGATYGLSDIECSGSCKEGFYCPAASTSREENDCGGPHVYCPQEVGSPIPVGATFNGLYGSLLPLADYVTSVASGWYTLSQEYTQAVAAATSYTYKPANRFTQTRCEPGFYCADGIKYQCPAGRYGSTFGLSESFCSGSCSAGYFCPINSSSATQFECGSVDKYCPQGSATPTVADTGYYTVGQDGTIDSSSNSTRSGQLGCEPGHFCIYGRKYECFEGTFGDEALYPSQNRLSTRQVDLIWEQLQLRERENVCADINGGPRRDACSLDAADALGGAILATMSYSLCVDDIGNLNSGVACQDGATGTGYIMYSGIADVKLRFAPSHPMDDFTDTIAPHGDNADRFICVRYDEDEETWMYDSNLVWTPFEIDDTDLLVAAVDFDACPEGSLCVGTETVTSLQGTSSIVHGLHAGFLQSDLEFEANVWNGIPNGGEYYITGTYFCHGYIPDVLGVNPNEELVTDPSAEGRFLLYNGTCGGLCTEGYYCERGATNSTQHECGDEHFYCPIGSSKPRNVTRGFYTTPDDPTRNSTRTLQSKCPKGFYCAKGVRRMCPAGTYGNETGLVGYSTIQYDHNMNGQSDLYPAVGSRSAGYNRDGRAHDPTNDIDITSQCSGWCPRGHECPPGTAEPIPCSSKGGEYYATEGVSECMKCPSKPAYLNGKTQDSKTERQCYDSRRCCYL